MGADHRADLGDEDRVGAEDLAALVDQARGRSRGRGCAGRPRRRRRRRWRSRANSTMRSNARRRVRTRSTGVISSSSVRIGLICSAEPSQRLRGADPAAPAQVLERVDREPHLQRLAGALDRAPAPPRPTAPAAAARAATSAIMPWPPQPVRLSKTWIRSPPLPSSISCWRAWQCRLVGARDPGRDVDRDDVAARRRAAARRREEVADRGLRGGRALGRSRRRRS